MDPPGAAGATGGDRKARTARTRKSTCAWAGATAWATSSATERWVWISGRFEAIDRPRQLVYRWTIEPAAGAERVTVSFDEHAGVTEVVLVHERIADAASRDQHAQGWNGCLDGLVEYLAQPFRDRV